MTDGKVLLDADIREPLFRYLEERYGKVRFLEEKVTGRARADVVMVLPGKVCGIEIKSDADTYARLAAQVKNYDRYYDENYIVAGSTHAWHVVEHVPEHWGIITVELIECGSPLWRAGQDPRRKVDFYRLREARTNPHMKLQSKLSLLWKSELAHIQAKAGLPKYVNKSKKFIAEKLIERVPQEFLQEQISEELFERDYTIFS